MRSFAILLALAAATRSASAEPETTHYYQYTVPADAVGLALYYGGAMAEGPGGQDTRASSILMPLGLASSLLATPLVHAARGHWQRGLTSFFLRFGLASVTGIAAASINPCSDSCGLERYYVGAGIGFALASVIDAAVMTDEKAPPAPTWSPTVTARSGGVVLGVGRAF